MDSHRQTDLARFNATLPLENKGIVACFQEEQQLPFVGALLPGQYEH